MGYRDPGAFQSVLVEERRVVFEALAWRQARDRRGIGRVVPGQNAQQLCRVGHGARYRTRGVLVGGDRHDPRPADEPDGRFDADQQVCTRRAKDRAGGLRTDADGRKIGADGDAGPRARSTGIERRTPVVPSGQPDAVIDYIRARVGARIERVEPIADAGDVAALFKQLEPELRAVAARVCEREEVRELGQRPLAEDDCAGALQFHHDERVFGGNGFAEGYGARCRRHAGRGNVVLQDDRHAVQRQRLVTVAVVVGLAHQLARRIGGVRIDVHVAIQVRPRPVERRDARLIHLDQLLWRQKFGAIRPLDVGDRRLNKLEPLLLTTFGTVFAVRNCHKRQRKHRQHAHHVTRQTLHTRTPTYVLNELEETICRTRRDNGRVRLAPTACNGH